MDNGKKYFGYDEAKILEIFRNREDQVDVNSKIDEKSTLSQLVEASQKLLEENKEFLHMIYNQLDE